MTLVLKKAGVAGFATLAALGLAAALPSASQAASPYATISVTGFNHAVVQTAALQQPEYIDVPVQLALGTMSDFAGNSLTAGGGLPDNGLITSAGAQAGAPFQLASYTGDDVLQVSTNSSILTSDANANPNSESFSGTAPLTLATPGKYSSVGILWAASYGPSLADVTFNYVGGGTTIFTANSVHDWGSASAGDNAYQMGRIDLTAAQKPNRSDASHQYLFDAYFAVDPTQTLQSVTFTDTQDNVNNNAGNTVKGLFTVFAINGISAAPEPGETLALMLGGLGLLGLIAKKRKASA